MEAGTAGAQGFFQRHGKSKEREEGGKKWREGQEEREMKGVKQQERGGGRASSSVYPSVKCSALAVGSVQVLAIWLC